MLNRWLKVIVPVAICLLACPVFSDEAVKQEGAPVDGEVVKPEKPVSITKWAKSLQRDVGKIRPGRNKAEQEVVVAEHITWFKEHHPHALVEFTAKISEVRWEKGVAYISIADELPANERAIIVLQARREAIAVRMEQEKAIAIQKGTPAKLVANLFLADQSIGNSRNDETKRFYIPKWQAFYLVENTRLDCHLGRYYSGEYSLEIAGEVYQGAWADPPPLENADE